MRSPNCWYAQSRASSAVIASTSGSWSGGAVAKQHLLQGVAAEAAAERLERDDLVRRDVAEVDGRAELLDEPGLRGLRRRLEDDVFQRHRVCDFADELGAHVAGLAEDPCGPTLARFGDHLPGAGVELFAQPLRPLLRPELDFGVLRADLGENGEVARELLDQLELALARQVDHAVRDLDVCETEPLQPALVAVELVLHEDDLEERAADDDRLSAQHVELRGKPVVIGGTFFEVVFVQDKLDGYKRWLQGLGLTHVEISDGVIDLPRERKLELIEEFARDFTVLSEVGSKDADVEFTADEWTRWLREELDAGAWKVITEAREGGTAGIFSKSGDMRTELVGEIADAVPLEDVVFEAPTKAAQAWFIKEFGPAVNLGNIPPEEVIALETLRRGLRGDTLKEVLLGDRAGTPAS